eukprot:844633-Pleurochrysis_carterae.AAC.1
MHNNVSVGPSRRHSSQRRRGQYVAKLQNNVNSAIMGAIKLWALSRHLHLAHNPWGSISPIKVAKWPRNEPNMCIACPIRQASL